MATKPTKQLSGSITIDMDKKPDIPQDAARLQLAAETLEVVDEESFERAAQIVLDCANRIKTIEDFFDADKVMANKLHKSICAKITFLTKPYEDTRESLEDKKMKPYRRTIEAAQEAQQAEIQSSGAELRDELAARAKAARYDGNIKLAKEYEAQAASVVTDVVLPDNKPDVEGFGERRPWKGIVENPMELIAAVADGRIPLMHLIPKRGLNQEEVPILEVNMAVITYLAKRLGKDFVLPGCKAIKDFEFSAKGGV